MRKTQLLSASALSLILTGLCVSGQALAATTISTATTAPVVTTTTGDLTVDTAGKITLTSGTAITVDSNNTVTLNGVIDMSSSADNSTAILVSNGHTSGLTIAGTIMVTDNYTATDTLPAGSLDTVADYPFAQGTGRYGVHSSGASPFVGDVTIVSAAGIKVEGNNSYGVRFENNLNGIFASRGNFSIIGDNDVAISLESGATGNVSIGGTITTQGAGAKAVFLGGDYGGNVLIDGTFNGTGYATTNLSGLTAAQIAAMPAADQLQAGALVTIGGNVTNGVLLGSAFTGVIDTNTDPNIDSNPDEDGDGQVDSTQTTATLAQFGSAPALLVGSATSNITLGNLIYAPTATTPPAVHYGLLVRGSVSAQGVFSNIDGTAIQLGGTGHNVTIAGGVGIYGSAAAGGFEANSTAVVVGSGLTTPQLDIKGTVQSNSSSDTVSASTSNKTAYGIDIKATANLAAINVMDGAVISAAATGSTGNAVAIRDQSDTLRTITNNNIISSTVTATDDDANGTTDPILHNSIAVDAHSNTVGLTLTQEDLHATTSDADVAIAAPYIVGDILLGSGDDAIYQKGGNIGGNIDFGGGANTFEMSGVSAYFGKMTGSGTVKFNIIAGTASLSAGSHLNLTTLDLGATALLGLTLDTTHPTTPIFAGSGAATFANGAKLNLALNNVLITPQTFTVLTASSISLGNLATNRDGFIPYIYHADLRTDAGNTTLFADFRLKTQAEGQFSNNEFAALPAVLAAVGQDPGAVSSLMSTLTKDSFDAIYNQYLPDYSGEGLITLAQGHESLNQALGSLTLIPDNDGGQYWLQEYGAHVERKRGDTAGFTSTGFSFAGGRETAWGQHNMAGVYLSYTSNTPIDNFAIGQEQMVATDVSVGGYWRMRDGGFRGWAHVGAGFTQFETTRELLTTYVSHTAKATWNGYSYSGGLGASYDMKSGFLSVTPQLFADVYGLNEAAHSETGGGNFFDLTVDKRNSQLASGKMLINVSYNRWLVRPELWVGWKQNVSGDLGKTVANFDFTGAQTFTLNGGEITGGGPVAGFRISADNEYSYFSLEGDYQKLDAYIDYTVSLRTRFQF